MTLRVNKPKGGGVCIYLDNKYSPYCSVNTQFSACTTDFGIQCLDVAFCNNLSDDRNIMKELFKTMFKCGQTWS